MVDNPRKGKAVHSIVLPRLRGFHASMRSSGLTAAAFSYKNNKAELQILFITSEAPYVLVIAPQGVRPLSIVVDVQPGYKVVPFLGADYGPLLEMLGVERNPDNPFRVVDFFKDLDAHIPDSSTTPRSPKPHEMAARGHTDSPLWGWDVTLASGSDSEPRASTTRICPWRPQAQFSA